METTGTDFAPAIDKLLQTGRDSIPAAERIYDLTIFESGKEHAVQVALVPDGDGRAKIASLLDIEKAAVEFQRQERLRAAPGPDRREGTAKLQALDSLIGHAIRFKDGDSAVWADEAGRKLVVVLDYHRAENAPTPEKLADALATATPGQPRWGKHRGIYECPLSTAWLAWYGDAVEDAENAGVLELDQDEFAAFLDAHDRDLVAGPLPNGTPAPAPTQLITLANNLETYSEAKAKRERDPNGRLKVTYSSDQGVAGSVQVPPSFLIKIPVFQDSEPQVLEVRLRVEVEDAAAKFIVKIHAAEDVLRDAFRALCERVKRETGLPVFVGEPE